MTEISYRDGDVLKSTHTYIAHGCNCQGVMGKGVALQIKQNYPKAYEDYLKGLDKGAKLGDVIVSDVGNIIQPRLIFNCLTQFTYSSRLDIINVDYDAVRSCMLKINKFFEQNDKVYVGMPRIGAGLGGGDWDIISKIIEEESIYFTPVVYTL